MSRPGLAREYGVRPRTHVCETFDEESCALKLATRGAAPALLVSRYAFSIVFYFFTGWVQIGPITSL